MPAPREPEHGRAAAPVLIASADGDLVAALQRIAAAAGTEVDVASEAAAAADRWPAAHVVVVGADLIHDLAAFNPPSRGGVVIVGQDRTDTAVYRGSVVLHAEHIAFLPDAEPWLIDRFADAAERPRHRARLVAVIGARGGAGATSFAVALALAGARVGWRTALVDVDPYGGGIDLALGAEASNVVVGTAIDPSEPDGNGSGDLPGAVPVRHGEVTVLAWSRQSPTDISPNVVAAIIAGAARDADLVVLDLPRSFTAATRAALAAADVAFVVCPTEVRACAAGQRIASTVELFVGDVRAVVRGPAPTDLDAATVADTLGVPLAGWLDAEPAIDEALDRGLAPGRGGKGPLAQLCATIVRDLLPPEADPDAGDDTAAPPSC